MRRIFRSESSPPKIMINGFSTNFDLIIYVFQLWRQYSCRYLKSLLAPVSADPIVHSLFTNLIRKLLYKNSNLPSCRFAAHDTKQFLVFSLASRWPHQCPCPEAHIFFRWLETQCSRSVWRSDENTPRGPARFQSELYDFLCWSSPWICYWWRSVVFPFGCSL